MSRGLLRSLLAAVLTAPMTLYGAHAISGSTAAGKDPRFTAVLQRFLSLDDPSPIGYRALRRLDAASENLNKTAWMDVWTESDKSGALKYNVVGEGGSGYIRSKVFLVSLETEKKLYESGAPSRAALTLENYLFTEGAAVDGLSAITVTPRRKDVLLVNGSIFLRPEDGDLVRIEGRLSKAPSFWIRQVDIVRSYRRIAGVRMPVAVEAVANIRLAGTATFRMTYEYETVNGLRVGAPEPRRAKAQSLANAEP
jgi:hypothetical protein